MRNAVVRRPSNKGLFGKASSTRVGRRPTNMTVMAPPNQAELSRWYYDQEYRRDGHTIPRPVEIHCHQKSNWGNVVGIAGGTFAAAVMGLMLLPSLVTALVFAILFMALGSLVVALAVSTLRGLPLSSLLFARRIDEERGHAQSR